MTILDSDERIPFVSKHGDYYYNFSRNQNKRSWRRTTLEEYRKPTQLGTCCWTWMNWPKRKGKTGSGMVPACCVPKYDLALIDLSRGGADASVTREFNLETRKFVDNGFQRPEAKGGMNWIDRDNVFVYTDFGDGSMTSSGYPRIAKRWQRGTPLGDAKVVYEGKDADMYIAAQHDDSPGYERNFVSRTLAFYNDELYVLTDDAKLTKIDVPNSVNKSVFHDYLLLELREFLGGWRPEFQSWLAIDDQFRCVFSWQKTIRRGLRTN